MLTHIQWHLDILLSCQGWDEVKSLENHADFVVAN